MPPPASVTAVNRLNREFVAISRSPPPLMQRFHAIPEFSAINASVAIGAACYPLFRTAQYARARPTEEDILVWHFLIQGSPDTPYEGGYYWGVIKFDPDYPFKPPKFVMLTPSGRFVPEASICLSISHFHPSSWNPSWTVSTMLIGLVSFMNSDEPSTGTERASLEKRRSLAKQSMEWNRKKTVFCKVFAEYASPNSPLPVFGDAETCTKTEAQPESALASASKSAQPKANSKKASRTDSIGIFSPVCSDADVVSSRTPSSKKTEPRQCLASGNDGALALFLENVGSKPDKSKPCRRSPLIRVRTRKHSPTYKNQPFGEENINLTNGAFKSIDDDEHTQQQKLPRKKSAAYLKAYIKKKRESRLQEANSIQQKTTSKSEPGPKKKSPTSGLAKHLPLEGKNVKPSSFFDSKKSFGLPVRVFVFVTVCLLLIVAGRLTPRSRAKNAKD